MTKENTLYLPIKQVYFDQIIDGSKKEEYREVKGTTAGKYLMKDENGAFVRNPECTQPDKDYFIEDYNGGNFPFLPRQYKYLSMAVGTPKSETQQSLKLHTLPLSLPASSMTRLRFGFAFSISARS